MQQTGSVRRIVVRHVPSLEYRMDFQRLRFTYRHLVVSISGNQQYIIQLADSRKLVGFQGKPHIVALLDHRRMAALLDFAQMLVVKDDAIFNQSVFKLPLRPTTSASIPPDGPAQGLFPSTRWYNRVQWQT